MSQHDDEIGTEIQAKIKDIREFNEQRFLSLAKYTSGMTKYNREYFIRIAQSSAANAICNIVDMAKAYYVLRTMETEESFTEICETRMGVSKSTGYNWAKVGEAFGGYSIQQLRELGTAEVSKLQIIATAPAEEVYHLLTDGTFYGKEKDEIVNMSRRELTEFMAKQRYLENLIETLKDESSQKGIKLRESELERKDLQRELESLREGDAARQMPDDLKRFAELFDAAQFTLMKLYNYMNDNHKAISADPDIKDFVNGNHTRIEVLFDNITKFVRERILFPRGKFPEYEVPGDDDLN